MKREIPKSSANSKKRSRAPHQRGRSDNSKVTGDFCESLFHGRNTSWEGQWSDATSIPRLRKTASTLFAAIVIASLGLCRAWNSHLTPHRRGWHTFSRQKDRGFGYHDAPLISWGPEGYIRFTKTCLFDIETSPDIDLSKNGFSANDEKIDHPNILAEKNTTSEFLDRSVKGDANSMSMAIDSSLPEFLQEEEVDAPRPTENGGYTHTKASRAKISAANKGKTPWNKGKHRSDEVRARISAGVRAKNRERFLKKLEDLGITEEEYEAQKREERRKKEADKRARLTANGGYRPTEETKRKISDILKHKYASGQVKPRKIDPAKIRRGFTHSEETRRKISESLQKRWANDPAYRAKMVKKSTEVNSDSTVRQKISDSLRRKWQDPDFRSTMLSKIATRKQPGKGYAHNQERRDKISAAMKAKWQDEGFRKKAQAGLAKRSALNPNPTKAGVQKKKPKTKTVVTPAPEKPGVDPLVVATGRGEAMRVVQPRTVPRKKTTSLHDTTIKKKLKAPVPVAQVSKPKTPVKLDTKGDSLIVGINDDGMSDKIDDPLGPADETNKPKRSKAAANGNVDLLKEERRDLYDLLYGDEDKNASPSDDDFANERLKPNGSKLTSVFALEDDNLDTFDPYGLEDF